MKFSKLFVKTLKEDPKEAEIISHKLLIRTGMIKKLTSGIYSFLPLGNKVLKKVENIVREEMNQAGAQEVVMPIVQPAELWQESKRWYEYGPELCRLKDRHGRDFVLGPTHEEVITDIVRNEINSYKNLPVNLYQIQTKFRDERRPRFGIMRGREFLMKDSYSFHTDMQSLDDEYNNMHKAYNRIFTRCGLNFRSVEADAGNIGGSITHEIMVLAESGEDEILYCDSCEYAANMEKAESVLEFSEDNQEMKAIEKVSTPGKQKIEDVAEFLEKHENKTVKGLIFKYGENFCLALIRGDYEINEIKLKNYLKVSQIELASDEEIEKIGFEKGFIGPVNKANIRIIADETLKVMKNFITGGNEKDIHFTNTNLNRDFEVEKFIDIRKPKIGEKCPRCENGKLKSARGIEVGHIFKLGDKYSDILNCKFTDENGKEKVMLMGCYGIGVSRIVAAAVEQNYDDFGIKWPISLAPFHVDIIPVNSKDEEQIFQANKLYEKMLDEGIEVILDDRSERAGFKFKDADLIGIPIKIVVGKGITSGKVEIKLRSDNSKEEVEIENVISNVKKLLRR